MKDKCLLLHKLFNSLKRFHFPFDDDLELIPKNGIYIIFEKGETFKGFDRVVRVGTHTGDNQLRSRLYQHFTDENKDRSIFRKNIGRCFLNLNKNPYAKIWELDFTTRAQKKENAHLRDAIFEKQLERKITRYVQEKLSFAVIEVNVKVKRLNLESRIISTLSLCDTCKPSQNWLGLHSPKDRIRESGLWQVNELYKEPLRQHDLEELGRLINGKIITCA
jgi:hypothetical protein